MKIILVDTNLWRTFFGSNFFDPKNLQSKTLLKIKTPSRGIHYVENAKIWAFSDLYFPIHGHNRIRIFPYLDRFSDSFQIQKTQI